MSIQNLVGQTLGQYDLRELLGAGGMGAVYRGYQASLKRYVAVKVLSAQLVEQPGALERFNREAETSAALEHPHIIHIYDYGTQRGISFLVMQLLTGGSLTERIEQHAGTDQPLPSLGEVSDLLKQLASALDYAHSQGVIHRDIKPSNVMFDNHGQAYLVDFGIAKLVQATSGLTASGMVIGTWAYMAPEQWKAETLTPATDQYALAVMTYALVTGQMPFDAPTPAGIMHQHLTEMPTPLHTRRADIPEAVTQVIERALAKKAENRFPTVTAFAQAFDKAIRGQTGEVTNFFTASIWRKPVPTAVLTPSQPVTAARPIYKHPAVWGMAAVMVAAFAVIAFLLLGDKGQKKTENPGTTAAAQIASELPTATFTPGGTPATAQKIVISSPVPSPTMAPLPTETASLAATSTSTPTPLPTATPDLNATVDALLALHLTETAESYTDTPSPTATLTPDLMATAEAQVQARMTATAEAYTDTPTATLTPAPTSTPTAALTVTPAPIPAGSPNRSWTPVVQSFDGVEMVLVPAGCFMMGSTDEQKAVVIQQCIDSAGQATDACSYSWTGDEQPVHEVCFDAPFWIDRTEVTNAQFGSSSDPLDASKPHSSDNWGDQSWSEAQTFCEKRGVRLPTEAEWEYAARGPESWIYPWGNEFSADNVIYGDNSNYGPEPVGSRPGGMSWVGALDMSGNMREWVSDWYGPYSPQRQTNPQGPDSGNDHVIRGGAYGDPVDFLRTTYRFESVDIPYPEPWPLGFRCARSYGETAVSLVPTAAAPAPPPAIGSAAGRIAFVSNRDGNSEIYVMNADGSNPHNLTQNSAGDYEPAWSPDGSRIAFVSDRDGGTEIYLMNADGGDPRDLTATVDQEWFPAWSPDGRQIAFQSYNNGNYEIYVMNTDASDWRNLTNSTTGDYEPTWSPDGSQIAFYSDRDGNYEIYVMNADGSSSRNLTNTGASDFSPAWSPDGRQIAFVSDRDGNNEIYVMNTDGSNLLRLTQNSAGDYEPAWSPDGSQITFVSDRDGGTEIYVMNADGSSLYNLTYNSTNDEFPAWQPVP